MARRLVVLLTIVVLLSLGAVAVRATAWTPVAPAALPPSAWAPIRDPEPAHWQTLDNVSFEAAGGQFVAELEGYRQLRGGSDHSYLVRIVRVGGEEAPLEVARGVLDGEPARGIAREGDALVARFGFHLGGPGEFSLGAELDVRAWREVAWGYREVAPVHLVLRAELERNDATM